MTLSEFLGKAGGLFKAAEKIDGLATADNQSEVQALKDANETLQTDLAAAQGEITQLKEKIAQKDSELATAQTSIKNLQATIDKPEGEIEKRSGLKSKEIVKSLGVDPLPTTPAATGGGTDILAQYAAIKTPAERTEFYRKNKAAYDAAFRASQNPS